MSMKQIRTTVSETVESKLKEQAAKLELSPFTYVRRLLSAVARGDIRYEEKIESEKKPFFLP